MIKIFVSQKLIRELNKIEKKNYLLFKEILQKIEELRDFKNHKKLGVHKLHGKQKGKYSFDVTYKHRIIFEYQKENIVILLTFGDHSIYE